MIYYNTSSTVAHRAWICCDYYLQKTVQNQWTSRYKWGLQIVIKMSIWQVLLCKQCQALGYYTITYRPTCKQCQALFDLSWCFCRNSELTRKDWDLASYCFIDQHKAVYKILRQQHTPHYIHLCRMAYPRAWWRKSRVETTPLTTQTLHLSSTGSLVTNYWLLKLCRMSNKLCKSIKSV